MPLRVLLIEDNKFDLEIQTRFLTRAGFNVETATNGPDGVMMARAMRPDIILCDMVLKNGNGYQVVRDCDADIVLRHIPLIAITGQDSIFSSRADAMQHGFADLLIKPLDVGRFAELARVLCPE
jgi:CheY-like chemotaxis protein